MRYRALPGTSIEVSVIGLGGHEYLADGRSRGFNEDHKEAVRPGKIFEGFGQEKRLAVLSAAFDAGINFLDVTIDSEKESLGRNLEQVPAPHQVFIQTRPEGMAYTYDQCNRKMANYDLLRAEVERILTLLRRESVDFLNFPFMQEALDDDPAYLDKTADNIARLKDAGLIRFATADTFSGESVYLRQIQRGCFDTMVVNFNMGQTWPMDRVFPAAKKQDVGIITREVFAKGNLFKWGAEMGVSDTDLLARAALRWSLGIEDIMTVIAGADNVEQLRNGLRVLESAELTEEEGRVLDLCRESPGYGQYTGRTGGTKKLGARILYLEA